MIDYSVTNSVYAETLASGRTYMTPDGDFPSMTTILGKTSENQVWLQKWIEKVGEEEAARISKAATDRGTLVHEYAEKHFNGEDIKPDLMKERADVREMTANLIKAGERGIEEVWAQEIALWSPSLHYAGRVDLVGKWKGIPSIVDFKTSKKKKNVKQIKDYYVQCCGYAFAHNELFNTEIKQVVILITVESGGAQIFTGNMQHYLPELRYRVNKYHELLRSGAIT